MMSPPVPSGDAPSTLAVIAGVAAALGVVLALATGAEEGLPPTAGMPAPVSAGMTGLSPHRFATLPGWAEDDHAAALVAFRRGCDHAGRDGATPLGRACRRAERLPDPLHEDDARLFFERNFVPFAIRGDGEGLLTAYYEPEIPGARTPSERFVAPLHALPEGHVILDEDSRPDGFDPKLTAGLRAGEAVEPYPDRAAIEAGALEDRLEPLVWLENPVDAFFVHVQGSTRVSLPDGDAMRVGFAGKNGHPYVSIGREMRLAGIEPEAGLGMRGIRDYLLADPERGREIMDLNPSYIFFREIDDLPPELGPVGAAGVPLTPGRSLAVDPAFHDYGLPVWVVADLDGGRLARLVVAQDTGSAIRGAARGDLFWGTGAAAGEAAGEVQAPARFFALLPK